MTQAEELAVARALRVALGYESREARIALLKGNRDILVRGLMQRLENAGWLSDKSVAKL